ncbi:MAG: hypothetical protein MJK10_09190 [Pseudomonadales bacterium]|nr:hypothetical protein [Pseudomonadales bacterium]NRA16219.1 hypothetical protein [Oceanospirillaceae bacterium]
MSKKDSDLNTKLLEAVSSSVSDVEELMIANALNDENITIVKTTLEEIRANGGIDHLNLDPEIREQLMEQIRSDGLLTTH